MIGIVSASRKAPVTDLPEPDNSDGSGDGGQTDTTPGADEGGNENEDEKKLTFALPIDGEIVKGHSLSEPVFSLTLGEWRVHTGVDIAAEDNMPVKAAESGMISGIYTDPMHGCTVEITHSEDYKTRYSNLSTASVAELTVGDTVEKGAIIGTVGDTSVSELAEEPHLHFEMMVKNLKVNPLDYINLTDNGENEAS